MINATENTMHLLYSKDSIAVLASLSLSIYIYIYISTSKGVEMTTIAYTTLWLPLLCLTRAATRIKYREDLFLPWNWKLTAYTTIRLSFLYLIRAGIQIQLVKRRLRFLRKVEALDPYKLL
jgi:hypothetical protein